MTFRGLFRVSMLAVAGIASAFPIQGFAAAQLAAGAKTSAQPTSTNPQQRQLQITFDPRDELNVTAFQLSVSFDASKLEALDLKFIDPYAQAPTPPQTDNTNGLITYIKGAAPVDQTKTGDVNIFYVDFYVKEGVSLDKDLLDIKIFADKSRQDFIEVTDPAFPNDPIHETVDKSPSGLGGISETELIGTFNDFAAEVPLPATWCGGLALALMVALYRVGRRVVMIQR
jgi:hypothetical protein